MARPMPGGRTPDQRDSMTSGATDSGQGFVYSGQIEKGQMHGKGTLVYPNGELPLMISWAFCLCNVGAELSRMVGVDVWVCSMWCTRSCFVDISV